jgi:hypothetical protein
MRHAVGRLHVTSRVRGGEMDWIEQLFGISPDGGDGTTEAMIVLAVATAIAIIFYTRSGQLRTFIRKLLT